MRLRPELQRKPVAVLDGEPPFEQVCSLNGPALAMGIAPGMTKLEMEMFPTAVVLQRSRAEEAAARSALLECAGTFSPRVEDQSSDSCFTCVIDITGTETLFGSPDALGESLLKKIQALGIRASIAISSNFHAARCLARGHSGKGIRVVPRGMEGPALAPLPLTVLDLSPEHAETFSMWGITTLGALGKSRGNRVDCAAWTSGQRAAPAGTRRIAAFVYCNRGQLRFLKSEWSWIRRWNCSIRCFLSWE